MTEPPSLLTLNLEGWPVSVNDAYVSFKKKVPGRGVIVMRRLSADAEAYKKQVQFHIGQQLALRDPLRRNLPYGLRIELLSPDLLTKGWPATAKNRYKVIDASNYIKVLEDSLCEVLGLDDSHFFDVRVLKRSAARQMTVVHVLALNQE